MIDKVLFKLGYDLRKVDVQARFPFLHHFSVNGAAFDYWIMDAVAQKWYLDHAQLNEIECQALAELIVPEDSILEIGVHYGFYATFMSQLLGTTGRYQGIEMIAKAVVYSQAQFKQNNLGDNVQLIHAAAAEQSGRLNFNAGYRGNANGAVSADAVGPQIQSVAGDEFAANQVTLLKLDVEGFEASVLRGCQEILKNRPKIAMEVHMDLLGNFGETVESLFQTLPLADYEGYYFLDMEPGKSLERIPFDHHQFPTRGKANLFLSPKK